MSGWNPDDGGGTIADPNSGEAANGFDAGGVHNHNGDSGANEYSCFNCGEAGHAARECEQPKKMTCFNCGEEGHSKAECGQPRVSNGACNACGEEDEYFLSCSSNHHTNCTPRHFARDCTTNPPQPKACKNCLEEGHQTLECTNNRVINRDNVADKTEEEAWELLKAASDDKDLDDFKEAVKILSKAVPTYTYAELEKKFRARGFKVYLIAMEKDIGDTWTNVNLQGEIDQKFAVGYYFHEKPQRPTLAAKWPPSVEENLDRLVVSGVPMNRGVDKCNNCGKLGHSTRRCPDEHIQIERIGVTCALCGEAGHRVRDCKEERKKPRACKICEETDHLAKDCPKREKFACRNCGSEDHIAKDCEIIKCRNCDAEGHEFKECKLPIDYSRFICKNCGEKGHSAKRCKQPIKQDNNAGDETKTGGGEGWVNNATAASASGTNDWDVPASAKGW